MQKPDGFEDKARSLFRVDVLHVPEAEGEKQRVGMEVVENELNIYTLQFVAKQFMTNEKVKEDGFQSA